VARRVGWTEAALEDLSATAEYIARDSARYAGGFVREAFEASDTLTEFANRGRVVPEFEDQAIREIFLGCHRLIYQVTTDKIFILGLVHGTRDLAALWRREKRTGEPQP
jgi:plasmid stabilization system protein ParE